LALLAGAAVAVIIRNRRRQKSMLGIGSGAPMLPALSSKNFG
jgi:hypothetical protein